MNAKGFTLIELTAVIVVLVAIFLVSFPTFLNMAREDKEQQYKTMVEDLCLSGKSYIYSHEEEFGELLVADSTITIEISTLIQNNLVSKGVINKKSGSIVDNDSLTFKVLSDGSLDCKYNG